MKVKPFPWRQGSGCEPGVDSEPLGVELFWLGGDLGCETGVDSIPNGEVAVNRDAT